MGECGDTGIVEGSRQQGGAPVFGVTGLSADEHRLYAEFDPRAAAMRMTDLAIGASAIRFIHQDGAARPQVGKPNPSPDVHSTAMESAARMFAEVKALGETGRKWHEIERKAAVAFRDAGGA